MISGGHPNLSCCILPSKLAFRTHILVRLMLLFKGKIWQPKLGCPPLFMIDRKI